MGYECLHRHGHQIGLDDHEPKGPNWGDQDNDDVPIKTGMTMTMEPGVYNSKLQRGARVENIILITKDGCEPLGKLPNYLSSS